MIGRVTVVTMVVKKVGITGRVTVVTMVVKKVG